MRSGRAVHLLQRDSLPCFRNGFSCVQPKHAEELNLNLEDRRLKLAIILARELIGTPASHRIPIMRTPLCCC